MRLMALKEDYDHQMMYMVKILSLNFVKVSLTSCDFSL